MTRIISLISIGLILLGCKDEKKSRTEEDTAQTAVETSPMNEHEEEAGIQDLQIMPISHATAVFKWGDQVFYTDPVGGASAFDDKPKADFILVTDIHGDHMNAETLQALDLANSKIIVPKAVQEKLPSDLHSKLIVMNNGESLEHMGFNITAIPMYNLPETQDAMHVKGRGNGYVVEKNGKRLYISGDTEDIPEMRNLKNIDVALVSMNLPYTMPIDQAANGVLAFQPKKVIPYHYRGKDGFSDVEKFKQLVTEGNEDIRVELLEWYPERSN